ncbi:hypothetical protein ABT104_28605 [Streptomyces mobaraensis]
MLTITGAATGSVLDSCGTWAAGSTVVVDPDRQHTTQRRTVLS